MKIYLIVFCAIFLPQICEAQLFFNQLDDTEMSAYAIDVENGLKSDLSGIKEKLEADVDAFERENNELGLFIAYRALGEWERRHKRVAACNAFRKLAGNYFSNTATDGLKDIVVLEEIMTSIAETPDSLASAKLFALMERMEEDQKGKRSLTEILAAVLLQKLGLEEKSKIYLDKFEKSIVNCPSNQFKAEADYLTGLYYGGRINSLFYQRKIDEAYELFPKVGACFEKAVEYYNQIQDYPRMVEAMLNRSHVLPPEEKDIALQKAIAISKAHNTPRVVIMSHLTGYYAVQKDYENLIAISDSLMPILEEFELWEELRDVHFRLSQSWFERAHTEAVVDSSITMYQKAFEESKIWSDFRMKVAEQNNTEMAQRYETIYNTKEKESALAEQTLRAEKQRLQIIALIVVLGLLVILFVVLLILRKQKRSALENELAQEKIRTQEAIQRLLQEAESESVETLLKGQQDERKRIARELHDGIGVLLSTVKLNFDALEEQLQVTKTVHKKSYDNALERLDTAVEHVRLVSREMHSGVLAQFGLEEAVNRIAESINETGLAHAEVSFVGDFSSLDVAVQNELYKMIQELAGNALKHSGAKKLSIQILSRADAVAIVVEDNGRGFDMDKVDLQKSLGLRSLVERADQISATIAFDSGKGSGTTATVEIPMGELV